jgi:hypothetical protein
MPSLFDVSETNQMACLGLRILLEAVLCVQNECENNIFFYYDRVKLMRVQNAQIPPLWNSYQRKTDE